MATVLATACTTQLAPATKKAIQSKIPATYDYEPKETAPPASAQTTVLLVNPQFAPNFEYARSEVYRQFAESMAEDFEELLTARGFTVIGPYESYDEVVFSAKENSDLLLSADLDIEHNADVKLSQTYQSPGMAAIMLGAQPSFGLRASGQETLSGKITLQIMEPTTQEKLWVKSVPVPSVTYPVQTTQSFSMSGGAEAFRKDPGFHNPTVEALRKIYASTMDKTCTYLEPRELQRLKPQADRIRADSQFVR